MKKILITTAICGGLAYGSAKVEATPNWQKASTFVAVACISTYLAYDYYHSFKKKDDFKKEKVVPRTRTPLKKNEKDSPPDEVSVHKALHEATVEVPFVKVDLSISVEILAKSDSAIAHEYQKKTEVLKTVDTSHISLQNCANEGILIVALSILKDRHNITAFHIQGEIGEKGVQALSEFLKSHPEIQDVGLTGSFADKTIKESVLKSLAESLAILPNLQKITIDGQQYKNGSLFAVMNALKGKSSLKEVTFLGGFEDVSGEDPLELGDKVREFLESVPHLKTLSLGGFFQDRTLNQIKGALSQMKQLESLSLSGLFEDTAFSDFSPIFEHLKSVEISGFFKDKGVQDICDFVSRQPQLIDFSVSGHFGNTGAEAIANLYIHKLTLTTLSVQGAFEQEGASKFAEVFAAHPPKKAFLCGWFKGEIPIPDVSVHNLDSENSEKQKGISFKDLVAYSQYRKFFLKDEGKEILSVPGDGNCGFYALGITRKEFADRILERFNLQLEEDLIWRISLGDFVGVEGVPTEEALKGSLSKMLYNDGNPFRYLPVGVFDQKLDRSLQINAVLFTRDSNGIFAEHDHVTGENPQGVLHKPDHYDRLITRN